MSMEVLKEFLIAIGVKVNPGELAAVDSAVGKTAASAAKLDASATAASMSLSNRLAPALSALLSPLSLVTAAIGVAYHEMFGFIKKSAEELDDVAKLSNRVNASAESILKLGYIAQVSGSSVEAARASLDGLSKAAGEAALGVGRSKKIFEEIGLSVKDSNGHLKDTGTLLLEVGDKIKGMERGKQLAVLEKLRIDPTLVDSITTNVSSLSAEFDKLYKAANLDPKKAAESAEKFNDTLDKLGMTFQVIKESIATSFFDTFTDGFEEFRQNIVNNLPKIIDTIKPVIAALIKIGEIVLRVGKVFFEAAGKIVSAIKKIDDATGGWAIKIALVTLAWKKLNLAFLASSIGIIIGLATALALLYDDYETWKRGGKSFIDWGGKAKVVVDAVTIAITLLKEGFNKALSFIKYVVDIFVTMIAVIKDVINIFEALGDKIHEIYSGIRVGLQNLTSRFKESFSSIENWFKSTWQSVYDWFDNIFKKIINGIDKVVDKTESFAKDILPGLSIAGVNPIISAQLAPSPATAGAISNNKNVTINHKTDIHVNGSGNPYETATAVKNVQRQVNADQLRNTQGAVQ